MNEKDMTSEKVREEHLKNVNEPLHWTYMLAVMLGALAVMIVFMALLGGGA